MANKLKSNIKNLLLKDKNEVLNISKICNNYDILDFVAKNLSNGVKIIQFYIENLSDRENLTLGNKIHQLTSFYEALFIINKRLDLAQILNSDGVFLTYENINIKQAQHLIGEDKIIATDYDFELSDYIIKNYQKENKIFNIESKYDNNK